jgi:hypothetical protein
LRGSLFDVEIDLAGPGTADSPRGTLRALALDERLAIVPVARAGAAESGPGNVLVRLPPGDEVTLVGVGTRVRVPARVVAHLTREGLSVTVLERTGSGDAWRPFDMDVRWPPPAASRGAQKALELALYVPAPTRRRSGASTAVFVAPTGDAPPAIAVRGSTDVAREAITLPELLIDSRRLAPTRSAPPRFLLVAPPEAAAVAHRLWDMMVARLGADRVVFDHDGRVFGTQLDDGANAGMVSERVDAVLLLADADPSSWLPLAVRRAIWEERVPLLSVPLTENWAAARGRWPKSLHRAAQRAAFHGQPVPPVGWIGHGDEDAFHLVLELLEAWRPDGWSDPRESTSPAVPSAAEPAPPSIGMSLRSRFATMLDKRTDDELGLFRVALRPTGFSLERASAWPSDTRPALLLVHGELSDVQGTFAHLLD